MAETKNYGKVRTFIDWEDTGVPVFDQTDTDNLNLINNPAFFFTKMQYTTAGTITVVPHISPDDPIKNIALNQSGKNYKNINPFGVEFVEITITSGGAIQLGSGFNTELIPDTDYTLWAWVASENDYINDAHRSFVLGAYEFTSDLVTITHATNTPHSVTGGWGQHVFQHHFTTNSDAAFLEALIFAASDDVSVFHGVILGLMLVLGSSDTIPVWNNGTALGDLDEITSYVLSANGSIGKTQWETKLFDEGTLTITLDNQSKFFSPENRDSPLYGYMNPYLRVWVLFSDSNDAYTMLWSGFTQQFALQTGIYNDRQATITCRQGKYAIDAQDVTTLMADDGASSSDAIDSMFAGGYIIATGTTDPLYTTSQIMQETENGVTIPIFGVDFVGKTDPSLLTTLENIAELNGNYLWLSRYGRIIFRAFDTVKDAEPTELPYGLTLETHYMYAPFDLYKSIVVNYDVYILADSGVEMQGQEEVVPAGSSAFPFFIYPTYNSRPMIGNVVLDVASFLPVDYNVIIASGSANASIITHTEGIYTWFASSANNTLQDSTPTGLDARISFVSRASTDVWYADETNKSLTVTGIGGKGLPTLTYANPLITTDSMASNFANQQAIRRASIVSWFDTAKIANKNAQAVDFLVSHSVGDVIFIQEEQSGNIPKHLIIIGEEFNFTPTYLEVNYSIAPTGGEVDIAAFTYHPTELLVDFEDLSRVAPEATYLWNFGD